ncbi:MAG: hypothetical protein IJ796_11285 [Lachnospiraceae bacterium]|nr:hypothetical protein [Lachnospiraceae bacterium]
MRRKFAVPVLIASLLLGGCSFVPGEQTQSGPVNAGSGSGDETGEGGETSADAEPEEQVPATAGDTEETFLQGEEGNTLPDAGDTDSGDSTPEAFDMDYQKQIDLLYSAKDEWIYEEGGDDGYHYYAITDLDSNGRLEIIALVSAYIDGSEYTQYTIHEVNESGDGIEPVVNDIKAGVSMPDLLNNNCVACAIDKDSKALGYIFTDVVSDTIGKSSETKLLVTISDGRMHNEAVAYANYTYGDQETTSTFMDADANFITEDEYIAMEADVLKKTFADCAVVYQTIEFYHIDFEEPDVQREYLGYSWSDFARYESREAYYDYYYGYEENGFPVGTESDGFVSRHGYLESTEVEAADLNYTQWVSFQSYNIINYQYKDYEKDADFETVSLNFGDMGKGEFYRGDEKIDFTYTLAEYPDFAEGKAGTGDDIFMYFYTFYYEGSEFRVIEFEIGAWSYMLWSLG